MSQVRPERLTAEVDGDFVVFLIGMRINSAWRIHRWWPALLAMRRMIIELEAKPALGMLWHHTVPFVSTQYWRSFSHLNAYAKNTALEHVPAWRAFNHAMIRSRGAVGIWHETYEIKQGQYECVYVDMPPFGLGKVGHLVPAVGDKRSASQRMAKSRPHGVVVPTPTPAPTVEKETSLS